MRRPLRAAFVATLTLGSSACSRTPPPNSAPTETHNPPAQPDPVPTANPPPQEIQPPMVNPPPVPSCPAATPLDGTPCPMERQRCTYVSCGVPDGATSTCSGGTWTTVRVTCNPPPPPGR